MLNEEFVEEMYWLAHRSDVFPEFQSTVTEELIKNPKISVANPGMIKSSAAKAIAAPEIISYAGASFLLNCKNPAFKVFKPSYLA